MDTVPRPEKARVQYRALDTLARALGSRVPTKGRTLRSTYEHYVGTKLANPDGRNPREHAAKLTRGDTTEAR